MLVHSFDLFDTCITRMHAYPRDLFYDLGLRHAPASASETARRRIARRFQRARIRAEKFANFLARRAGREHANIEEIYGQFRWFMRLDRTIPELVQAELALEEESLYPVDEIITRIRQLRASGYRILYISDMYIPTDKLRPLLQRLGVIEPSDGLYVSCDTGCSKHSGRLFEHILKAEGITGAELVHMGDNAHADIYMAKLHGIQTVHFTSGHITEREAIIAGKRTPRKIGASWLAAFSRRCRLASPRSLNGMANPLEGTIFGVIIPFLLSYVLWVFERAHQLGVSRLYFVSRDGEILYRIGNILNQGKLSIRYLYGSRRAWIQPSISPDGDEWKRTLIQPGFKSQNTPYDILCRAGLGESEIKAIRKNLKLSMEEWTTPLCKEAAYSFLDLVTNEQATTLFEAQKQKNTLASEYFHQEGLLANEKWALVDTGWRLNCQAALRSILSSSTTPHQNPSGFYIALSKERLNEDIAGNAYPFIPSSMSIFSRRGVVVEHCFTPSTHATTIGYQSGKSGVEPIFGPEVRSADELDYANRLHAAAEVAAKIAAENPSILDAIRKYTPQIIANAERFLRHPTPEDFHFFASFGGILDPRHDAHLVRPLCRPLSLSEVWSAFQSVFSNQADSNSPLPIWPEGSSALSPWNSRLPMSAMLQAVELRDKFREMKKGKL